MQITKVVYIIPLKKEYIYVTMATVWAPVHSVLTLHLLFKKVSEMGDRCRQFYHKKSERTHFLLFRHRQFTCKVGHFSRNERSKDVEGSFNFEGMNVSFC